MTDPLSFPDLPRSELDRSIEELIARANDVKLSQSRLRALLRATQAVVEDIDLSMVLRRIVEAAVELVDAEYGALGVISADGHGLEAFIHVGMDDGAVGRIGHLPEGHGLLGAVIVTPQPIRLEHISADPRSSGFPDGHPKMDGFLGVPIRVRGVVYGNLYLTNPRRGSFSDEDEQLVGALAATAGSAIDHARILVEARTRERWMTSSAEIAIALADSDAQRAYATLADELISRSDSELLTILVPGHEPGTVHVAAARGEGSAALDGADLPSATTLATDVLASGESLIAAPGHIGPARPSDPLSLTRGQVAGPTICIALTDGRTVWGVLIAARLPGRPSFTRTDLEVGIDLGERISVALALARARADQQRVTVLEDRGRIARDLHDHVIQDLFGTGLELQSLAPILPDKDRARLDEAVTRIDRVIAQIRKIVFALTPPADSRSASVRHRILDIAADASKALPNPVNVSFSGPVDLFVTGVLADEVTAVARELLSNIVKHSGATETDVTLAVDDKDIRVDVGDDGIGIPGGVRRSGLSNLTARAVALGGTMFVTSSANGTRVEWHIPIPDSEGGHG
ncbi:GAF domain-containing protein [Herbiconiux sp. VKM Ac-1786]|uniref:sensor histidine kinase n=1 Tax=Herbiconiux sp. VKM Ac-1786 TaxID=2783824 RepID=UPI00188C88F8|nr:GAF domain-containing protein [Herbiconiux sp. VKM Ac-1786]MBF4571960.1 GAF domain-containing protein [Herbiconiux sp. VKM Ac-1786]